MSITRKTDFTYRSLDIYVFICLSIFFFLVYVVYSYLYVLRTMNAVEVEITTVKTGFEPKSSTIADTLPIEPAARLMCIVMLADNSFVQPTL